jgi:nucleoside phosphorylase
MPPAVTTDVLVVAAHPPELVGLKAIFGEGLRGKVGDLEVAAAAVGIGLADAAAGMAEALRTVMPRCVVLIGTCGVYESRGGDLGITHVVAASRIRLASTAAVEGRGAFPAPMAVSIDPDASLSSALAGAVVRRVAVATTLAITTDDALAARVSHALECEVEHLEAFAVVAACARLHVPAAVILGVANRVGSRAREDWLRHHEAAGQAAADVVATWLRAGGAPFAVRT